MLQLQETGAFCSRVGNKVTAPEEESERSQVHFLGEITDVDDSSSEWTVKLPIQGTDMDLLWIVSGADTSVIPEENFNQLKNKPRLKETVAKLDSPGGKLSCLGHFIATTIRKEKSFRFKVNVTRGSHSSHFLSHNVAVAMSLIKRIEEVKTTVQLKDSSPEDGGKLKIKPITITVKEDAVPYNVSIARRVSVAMLPKVK